MKLYFKNLKYRDCVRNICWSTENRHNAPRYKITVNSYYDSESNVGSL